MKENKMLNIIKYYLEYEIYNILNSASIKIDKTNIILKNIEQENLYKQIEVLKQNKLEKEIVKFIGKKVQNVKDVIKQINFELSKLNDAEDNKSQVSNIIKQIIEENLKYGMDKKLIKNFVDKLCDIKKTQEFLMYIDNITNFISKNNNFKLPIFVFKCKLINEKIDVVEVSANTETLNKILAVILDKEFSEVVVEYEEIISNFNNEIKKSIDGGNIKHLLNLFYTMLEESIGVSKHNIENIDKINDKYKMHQEYIISLEELASEGIKNIKEDIELLIRLIQYDNYTPNLLNKYLIQMHINKNDINDEKYIKPYIGSYKSDYGVGQTQYKIINAIKENDLIAVEGPPGTGKTSLLKEIIANNIVERANLIILNWDNSFQQKQYYGTQYYDIGWYHNNSEIIKSMVVSSKNGEAIDNIEKEINKEIRYMYLMARKYKRIDNRKEKVTQNYKGIVCLPLGKQDNVQSFKDFLYEQYIPKLEKIRYRKGLDKYCELVKKRYEAKLHDVQAFEKLVEIFKLVKDREKYFYHIKVNEEDKQAKIQQIEKIFLKDKTKKETNLKNIENEKDRIYNEKGNNEKEIQTTQNRLKHIKEQINFHQKEILSKQNEIEKLQETKLLFEKNTKNLISKLINYKFYKENKHTNFDSKIKENEIEIETEKIRIAEQIKNEDKIEEQKNELLVKQEQLQKDYKEIKNKIQLLEEEIAEMDLIELFNQSDNKKYWHYKDILDMYGHSFLNTLNQELFTLALKLNEAYILKNSRYIIENLKLFLPEEIPSYICQKFYDSSNIYNDEKKQGIRCLWNTMFLCFPVITTTLDSFCQKCFHLIPEYIDLELIDEAGQILPHNLVSALYRGKKAVIVGDVNQIEPIYTVLNKNFDESKKQIGKNYEYIKIEGNSVQALANKNTDILSYEEPIILNEHYRCERNIVDFVNKSVYENKLVMNKRDDMNKPFSNNMIALDIRGKKEEKENVNIVEVESCIETVKYILEQYKDAKKPTIAIITPFKKQKVELENRLKELSIKDIKVGTVHAFQGQQKDYIIFSQVLDSLDKKYLVDFIGKKCNMLNVAVTRAKKQFIFIGNLDVSIKAGNFSTKLVEYIRKNGIVYSLYDITNEESELNWNDKILSILQPECNIQNDNIGLYIQKHFNGRMLTDAKEHYEFLKYAIQNAKKEIYIMSPWYRENVINTEFVQALVKLKENNCKIKINFGYRNGNTNISNAKELVEELKKTSSLGYTTEKIAEEIANVMYQTVGKESFVYAPPTHAKILIIDEKYMCIGSHNWLSNAGETDTKQRAKEASIITTNKMSISYVKCKVFV